MVEFVTHIAALGSLAAVSLAATAWVLAEKRKERSRVPVPTRIRSRRR